MVALVERCDMQTMNLFVRSIAYLPRVRSCTIWEPRFALFSFHTTDALGSATYHQTTKSTRFTHQQWLCHHCTPFTDVSSLCVVSILAQVHLEQIKPPGFFGEAEVLRGLHVRQVRATSLEVTKCMALPVSIFEKMLISEVGERRLAFVHGSMCLHQCLSCAAASICCVRNGKEA